jgi:hypothetical protein
MGKKWCQNPFASLDKWVFSWILPGIFFLHSCLEFVIVKKTAAKSGWMGNKKRGESIQMG